MYNKIKPKKLTLAALLIPGVLLFVMCCIVPLGVAFYFSLFNWDGGINKTFIICIVPGTSLSVVG